MYNMLREAARTKYVLVFPDLHVGEKHVHNDISRTIC